MQGIVGIDLPLLNCLMEPGWTVRKPLVKMDRLDMAMLILKFYWLILKNNFLFNICIFNECVIYKEFI
jgi:hypothetical protein